MGWTCPKCNRSFVHTDQWHSCVKMSETDHLKKCNESALVLYDTLKGVCNEFGPYRIEAVKASIVFKKQSTFLDVKTRRNHINLEFALKEPYDDFPVTKVFKYSKNKYIHFVQIQELEDLDNQLIGWLKESYEMGT